MRLLPPDQAAQVQPMPAGFAPPLTEVQMPRGPAYIRWSTTLRIDGHPPFPTEIGFPKIGDANAIEARTRQLDEEIWQVMEYARLGRFDLLAHTSPDRHKAERTISVPLIAQPAEPAKP